MSGTFNPEGFTVAAAKPLPVVLLLDTSGSMAGEKINTLNTAVNKMLSTFAKNELRETEFLVSVVTFGGNATLAVPPSRASKVRLGSFRAEGGTPLGEALRIVKEMIEDKNQTPSRAYRPLVVLVSDGVPTDEWRGPLTDFVETGRSTKCDRMAMGIGAEAFTGGAKTMLEKFVQGTSHQVFHAEQAAQIDQFFRFVTMSTVSRSQSNDPNIVPADEQQPSPGAPSGASSEGTPDEPEDSYW